MVLKKIDNWVRKHHRWCFKGMKDKSFKQTLQFKTKKKEFIIRGIIIILLGISSYFIPFIILTPFVNILLTAILLTAGCYELLTGIFGFPMITY